MKLRRFISFFIVIILFLNFNIKVDSSNIFYDTIGHWAFKDIFWASNDVMLFVGYEDGNFRPDNNITIAEYLSVLFRAADANKIINRKINSNEQTEGYNPLKYFSITKEHWAYNQMFYVMDYILDKDNKFSLFNMNTNPNRPITREEAIVLTSYFTSYPIDESEIVFKDISVDYKYINELRNLVNNGIIVGYPDNTFKPLNYITRAESTSILKKIYFEMKFIIDKYLNNVKIINGIFDDKYMYYGNYFNDRILNENDMKYIKVISTLEMIEISGRIPYNERENYDSNPIETLSTLRDNGYWNKIGVDYYLIKNGDYDNEFKKLLAKEIAFEYIKRDDLNDNASLKIIETIIEYLNDEDLILNCLNKWEENIKEDYQHLNLLFLKEKLYISTKNYEEALLEFNKDYKLESIDFVKIFSFNKSILLLNMKKYDEAIDYLKSEWNKIKNLDGYLENSESYDLEFKGAIKKIIKEKYENLKNESSEIHVVLTEGEDYV